MWANSIKVWTFKRSHIDFDYYDDSMKHQSPILFFDFIDKSKPANTPEDDQITLLKHAMKYSMSPS